ncbi:hypothetical protein BKA62DRAFT_687234 [Auriculariales sp. MPI-PUGE-AT-0066]|nr:hypothetical protein BKA62DRAFT_687234 [Auriculariales sp. MPI-PUGE-AT-0066]
MLLIGQFYLTEKPCASKAASYMSLLRQTLLTARIPLRNTLVNPRSIASPTTFALLRTMKTLTQAVTEDHDEMYQYWTAYKKAYAAEDTQTASKFASQLRWEVARHAAGEEIVVYPLMEKYLGAKGVELADHDRAEHQVVKEQLLTLEGLTAGTTEFDQLMNSIMEHLKTHNDSEEREDLPRLEKAMDNDESVKIAQSFAHTKMLAPTHAHPNAPNKPPYETLAGFLALPIDKIKDFMTTFPTQAEKESAATGFEREGGRDQLNRLNPNIS